jgi:hypothetical protein
MAERGLGQARAVTDHGAGPSSHGAGSSSAAGCWTNAFTFGVTYRAVGYHDLHRRGRHLPVTQEALQPASAEIFPALIRGEHPDPETGIRTGSQDIHVVDQHPRGQGELRSNARVQQEARTPEVTRRPEGT